MSEGIDNLPPLPPDAHAESRGQDEESDHFKRRVEQPVIRRNPLDSRQEEIDPISKCRRKLEGIKTRAAQKIFELQAVTERQDLVLAAQLHAEIQLLGTEQDALQDELGKLVAQAQEELKQNAEEPGTDEKTKINRENPFATLPKDRILAIRDIVREIPELNGLYSSYRDAEKQTGKTPLRNNLLAQLETTLKRGDKKDIERAELMLYERDDVQIDKESVSELKIVINSIPNLKKLHDQIYSELAEQKKKKRLARFFGGHVAITNVELVTSLVEYLRKQTDPKSKALLRILSYYSQKQKPQ